MTTGQEDGNGGSLAFLTETVGDPARTTTAPTTSSAAEVDLDGGKDWSAVANSNSETKRKLRVNASTATGNAAPASPAPPASPSGWTSSRTVAISTEDDSGQENICKAGAGASATSTAATRKPTKWKQAGVFESAASRIGGWLRPRGLGVPTEDENDHDEGGGGDFQGVRVTIETQTDDDVRAVTQGMAIEEGDGSKLPPGAKPWVPSPKRQVAPDPAPEVKSAPSEEMNKKVNTQMENRVKLKLYPSRCG